MLCFLSHVDGAGVREVFFRLIERSVVFLEVLDGGEVAIGVDHW